MRTKCVKCEAQATGQHRHQQLRLGPARHNEPAPAALRLQQGVQRKLCAVAAAGAGDCDLGELWYRRGGGG